MQQVGSEANEVADLDPLASVQSISNVLRHYWGVGLGRSCSEAMARRHQKNLHSKKPPVPRADVGAQKSVVCGGRKLICEAVQKIRLGLVLADAGTRFAAWLGWSRDSTGGERQGLVGKLRGKLFYRKDVGGEATEI